jgi:hypothetical protein
LAAPAEAGFVRGYQLANKLLIIALNDSREAQPLTFRSDLSLWLPSSAGYEMALYDGQGKVVRKGKISGVEQSFSTPVLVPLELAFIEVESQ